MDFLPFTRPDIDDDTFAGVASIHSARDARDGEVSRMLGQHEAAEPGRHQRRRLMRRLLRGYAGAGLRRRPPLCRRGKAHRELAGGNR